VAEAEIVRLALRAFACTAEEDSLATLPPSVQEPASMGRRFRILRPHAEGGLGKVFVAFDEELRREVALKEIKGRHADDGESRARFLLEAEITGGLEHPGIVPVYALGHYADGRPYYAMRFIRGRSLQDAIARFHRGEAAASPLSLRQLLARFLDVCNAVAYAHSRGVLHRDLKPSNIMLGQYGETLVVDWGLAKSQSQAENAAKATEAPIRPSALMVSAPTQMGLALGTPSYMSPEQAEGRLDQVGPASDVYSLGATLYCLLTGVPPFEEADVETVLLKVRDGEFRPPRQVKPSVPPALEAVCRKAMALRPDERYASPRALAEDIEHWLADEPVSAWREPWRVRARRWMGRHRTLVTASVAALLMATVSLTAANLLLQAANSRERRETLAKEEALRTAESNAAEAKRQHQEALEQKHRAETNAAEAKRQEKQAKQQAEIALVVNDFLQNDLLRQADSRWQAHRHFTADPDVKVRTLLDRAATEIDRRFADKPLEAAAIRQAIYDAYSGVGEFERAIENLSAAHHLRVRHLGADHASTLTTLSDLAASYQAAGRAAEAIKLYEQLREPMTKTFGAYHPATLTTLGHLALAYWNARRCDEAIKLHELLRELSTKKLGADHPSTLTTLSNLASAYQADRRITEAIKLFEQVREPMTKKLGVDHRTTLLTLNNLAYAYRDAGRAADAIPLWEQVRQVRTNKLGSDHSDTLTTLRDLAHAYQEAKQVQRALPLYRQLLDTYSRKLPKDHPSRADALHMLGLCLLQVGSPAEAEPLLRECLTIRARKMPDEWVTCDTRSLLGEALLEQKKYTDAEPLLVKGYEGMKERQDKIPPPWKVRLAEARERLVRLYDATGKKDKADDYRKNLEAERARSSPKKK
jgi:tRNA A-37 threonylcarbamoyl transferase component Bud32